MAIDMTGTTSQSQHHSEKHTSQSDGNNNSSRDYTTPDSVPPATNPVKPQHEFQPFIDGAHQQSPPYGNRNMPFPFFMYPPPPNQYYSNFNPYMPPMGNYVPNYANKMGQPADNERRSGLV